LNINRGHLEVNPDVAKKLPEFQKTAVISALNLQIEAK
jgi:hypothetical protein